ncbi:UNVERIFIED_ORG: outer membrane receptor protein involved in Fe transport [Sphingomonas sp. R1F5B]
MMSGVRLFTAALFLGSASSAYAQQVSAPLPAAPAPSEPAPDADAATSQNADDIVVTGTPMGRTRLDAPFAISSFSEATIARAAPISTADLLKTVPGFSAEPSGGQGGGQNLYVRGLPAGGWFYVQLQEDGLTLFDEPQESFFNIDTLYSLDLMTSRVEVVRGGTSPIFANNAPGGTVNAITRRGTTTPEGQVKITGGNHGFARIDGYTAGPVSDKVLYSLGGFYRRDDGYREPGFTADKGGQIRGSLSLLLGDVRIDVDGKYLNDRTAFYNPIPLANPASPSTSLSGLIDPLDGTLLSNAFRKTTQRTFFGSQAIDKSEDLADGIHTKVFETGAFLTWDAGPGLTITNKTRYTDARVGYDAVFSGSAPAVASSYLATQLARAKTGFGASVASVGFTNAATGAVYDPSATGGLVLESGLWTTRTHLKTIANDFRVSKVFDDGDGLLGGALGQHSVSFGVYYNHFDFDQDRLQNTILTNVKNQPDLLNVVAYNAAGQVVGSVTENGFVRYGNGVTRGHAEGFYLSPYIADSVKFGKFGVDGGLRYTYYDAKGGVYANTTRNLGNAATLADDNVGGLSGAFSARRDSRRALQWTVGAEYKIDPRVQLFARYTSSERLPRLQNVYQTQNLPVTSIAQGEGGIRTAFRNLSFGVVGFWSKFDDLSTSAIVLDTAGNVQTLSLIGKTETYGVEADMNWRPVPFFSLVGTATVQQPETKSLINVTTGIAYDGLDGKQLSRIPKYIFTATPTVYFDVAQRPIELSAQVYHLGRRYVDYTNVTALPAFTTLDLNLLAKITDRIDFQAHVSNLTNAVGLTEGNARVDTLGGQGTSEAIYARPIFGRIYTASLSYKW